MATLTKQSQTETESLPDLPVEVVIKILHRCEGKALAKVDKASPELHELVWKHCQKAIEKWEAYTRTSEYRHEQMSEALEEVGLELREDSSLCTEYIEADHGTYPVEHVEHVVSIMRKMHLAHQHSIAKELKDEAYQALPVRYVDVWPRRSYRASYRYDRYDDYDDYGYRTYDNHDSGDDFEEPAPLYTKEKRVIPDDWTQRKQLLETQAVELFEAEKLKSEASNAQSCSCGEPLLREQIFAAWRASESEAAASSSPDSGSEGGPEAANSEVEQDKEEKDGRQVRDGDTDVLSTGEEHHT